MRDVLVVLPGIMGSVLQKNGRDLWALSPKGVLAALRTLGDNLDALRLGSDPPDVDDLGDGVTADRLIHDLHMVPGLWKIDGYSLLVNRLLGDFDLRRGENFFEFPYDWRRDNRVAARRLAHVAHGWLRSWRQRSGNADARLILIAHSMGGLVCRYFLEVLEGWKVTRRLISFGTPYRGSLNALGFISTGLVKQLGPINILDLSKLLRSFTSVYQLLPIYPCCDVGSGSLLRVTEAAGIPNLDAGRAMKALQFHSEIGAAVNSNQKSDQYLREGYSIHPIVGTHQPTWQTARVNNGRIELVQTYPGISMDGDGTVPRVSATPIEMSDKRAELFVAEAHGSLQNSSTVLVQLQGLLASELINFPLFRPQPPPIFALILNDAYSAEETVTIRARCLEKCLEVNAASVVATVRPIDGRTLAFRGPMRDMGGQLMQVDLPALAAGAYRVSVGVAELEPSVSDVFVVGSST